LLVTLGTASDKNYHPLEFNIQTISPVIISWGDGQTDYLTDTNTLYRLRHVYPARLTSQTYTVAIRGNFSSIDNFGVYDSIQQDYACSTDNNCQEFYYCSESINRCVPYRLSERRDRLVTHIKTWGNAQIQQMSFGSCLNLKSVPNAPFSTRINSTSSMFDYTLHFGNDNNFELYNFDMYAITSVMNMFKYSGIKTLGLYKQLTTPPTIVNPWSMPNCINMSYMFPYATNFDDYINFIHNDVENLSYMFYGASNFSNYGRPLLINGSKLKYMNDMFYGTNFNQDISSWDFSGLEINAYDLTSNAGIIYIGSLGKITATNYNNLLISWNNNKAIYKSQNIYVSTVGSPSSSAAQQAKLSLIQYGWKFNDNEGSQYSNSNISLRFNDPPALPSKEA
jgi:hypothetical protein